MTMKKILLPLIILATGISVWAFKAKDDTKDSYSKEDDLVSAIATILERKHFSPKDIDDKFSAKVFDKYFTTLNPDKDVFLQSDIKSLEKYRTGLDEEIHGEQPLKFYKEAADLYLKRSDEVTALYKQLLSSPFDFTVKEKVQLDDDSVNFSVDENARKEMWRKRLKYMTLDRYTDLLDQRKRNMDDTAWNKKTDAQLEAEARKAVQTSLDRTFTRQKLTFTETEQFSSFVNVITDLMDPHTEYFAPVAKREFDESMTGRFYGIGAQLKDDDGAIKIASLITGSPAWKSGQILVNDEIIKVAQGKDEPVDVRGYAVTDAVKLIRGTKGTEVKLTMKQADGTVKIVSIIRDEIVQDEQFARSAVINDNGKKIGYIYLPEFYADFERPDGNRCSRDVAAEIIKLKKENVEGIVLDLRNNGGGSLPEVVDMVGLFIKTGPVVQVKDRDGNPSVLRDNDPGVLYDGPLAVMVNEFSASASEIFAAAIQDYKRGVIIGSTSTYGKGTVQRTLPLGKILDYSTGESEFGALKITFEKFYRINGGSTQLKGVSSDVVLPDPLEYYKLREKDNPSALGWDQIQKADYTEWNNNVSLDQVKQKANARINGNHAFALLKDNINWLSANADKEYSLNIDDFTKEQSLIKKIVKQDDELVKLDTVMDMQPVTEDREKYYNNADKAKGDRYMQWLQSIKQDLYLSEAANIINDMAAN